MARHNNANFVGIIAAEPRIKYDEDERPIMAVTAVNVIRADRPVGDGRTGEKYDSVLLYSQDEGRIKEISGLEVNDIVVLKGMIVTRKVFKQSVCPACGAVNKTPGINVYIYPQWILKAGKVESDDKGREWLIKNREFSNTVCIIGTVVSDPKLLQPKEGLTVAQYPIAIGRKLRILTDDPMTTTDYPWVKSYGKNAEEDKKRLHKGSEILVDGCIQARNVVRKITCPECGALYEYHDRAMEIVPYATEYLANFNNDEAVAQIEADRAEQIRRDVLRDSRFIEEEGLEHEQAPKEMFDKGV